MIKLVIFDVDGTLLDTESVYINSALKTAKIYGYPITLEDVLKTVGGNSDNSRRVISKALGEKYDYEEYRKHLHEVWDAYEEKEGVAFKKGAMEIIKFLKEENIPMAIATSTGRSRQEKVLERVGLTPYFDFMVFGDDVKNSKPNPDIYLKAIEHFDFNSDEMIIFEDSTNGIKSGVAAGVRVVYIKDYIDVPEDVVATCYKRLDNLLEGIDLIKEENK